MSVHNGLNGKPKGFTTNFTGLRRIKKNLGSAFVPTKRANIACFALNKVDGGFIVPYYKGRNPGKPDKDKPNESVSDYSPHFSEEPRNFLKIKKTWKSLEKRYKGVKVPRKYVKILKYNKNSKSVYDDLYPLLLSHDMYDLAYHSIKSNPGNMTPGVSPDTLSGWGSEIIEDIISRMANE